MPSISRIDLTRFARFACLVLVSACARSAPDLPPDYGSVNPSTELTAEQFSATDLNMSCEGILAERDATKLEASQMTGAIHDNREHNQTVGYFGALFILPYVATVQNSDEKQRLDEIQQRWDTLAMLHRFKTCSSAVPQ